MPPVKPAACMLVLILGLMAPMAHATTPGALWLHENWQLETSAKVQADGKALSTPGFRADGWLPITVPNTVLGAQVEAGLFPDPYYGNNLKDIPGFRDGRWMVMPEITGLEVRFTKLPVPLPGLLLNPDKRLLKSKTVKPQIILIFLENYCLDSCSQSNIGTHWLARCFSTVLVSQHESVLC